MIIIFTTFKMDESAFELSPVFVFAGLMMTFFSSVFSYAFACMLQKQNNHV